MPLNIIVVSLIAASFAGARPGASGTERLRITGTTEKVEWDQPYADVRVDSIQLLRIVMRIRIENIGSAPSLISRKIPPPLNLKVKVLTKPEGTGSYDLWGHETSDGSFSSTDHGRRPSSEFVVVLSPGDAFETLMSTGVQVDLSADDVPKTVRVGDEVALQAEVELSPAAGFTPATVRSLSARWRDIGELVSGTIWVGPVRFRVPEYSGASPRE